MNRLDIVRCLHEVFGNRGLHHIPGEPGTLRPGGETGSGVIVLDLGLSRTMLCSPAFASLNEFADGHARLAARGRDVPTLQSFLKESPLFQEGAPARDMRRALRTLLRQQEDVLARKEAGITALMLARRERLRSPLAFSRLLVELSLACLIRELLPVGMRQILRALRQRQNIFYFHFHSGRHRATERALNQLCTRSDPHAAASPQVLLCQSMLLMGYDPLVATVCASLLETGRGPGPDAPSRYCPVSFVTRICTRDIRLGSLQVREGDRCFLTLVPTEEDPAGERIAFGAGPHTCIGRSISLAILALAARIADRGFRSGFADSSRLMPEGAFLAFEDTDGQPATREE